MRSVVPLFAVLWLAACGGGDSDLETRPNSVERQARVSVFNFSERPISAVPASFVDVEALVDIQDESQDLSSNLGYLFIDNANLRWFQIYLGSTVPAPEPVVSTYRLRDSNSRVQLAQLQVEVEHVGHYWLFATGVHQDNVVLQQFTANNLLPPPGHVAMQLFQGDGRQSARRLDLYIDRQLRFADVPWGSLSAVMTLTLEEANGEVDILEAGTEPSFDQPLRHLWHSNSLGLSGDQRYLLATVNDSSGKLTLFVHGY
ncbi:hypothetical protein [Ferrimonas balearica]|uniref:hypothetical protein n=1 Tax=Ferrimonas balearica TaxID=44012 RepID=UPI001C99FC78|nr:hypothetical protein [Ferrimonas balearica]MBY5990617.1 hypothetical protein [Ferrimonas balearica]